MQTLTIAMPDDFHIHLRDGDLLATTVPHCADYCARAIVMPNLKPPVTNTELAQQYRQRILEHLPTNQFFQPLMTLYLTENTTSDDIIAAKNSGIISRIKYYPAGATTYSQSGIWVVPSYYAFESSRVVPLFANQTINWRIKN